MRLVAVGDIHANADALEAALRATDRAGYDLRVLIGDLLTYGADVARTLDLVADALKRGDTTLILGNHDEMYSRLLGGQDDLLAGLPAWVADLLEWTVRQIPAADWFALPFTASFVCDDVYFSHANPFGTANWTYLSGRSANMAAAEALRSMGMSCGVFGHTHRARRYASAVAGSGDFRPIDFEERPLDRGSTHVLNAGSVGQPRSDHPRAVVLWLDLQAASLTHHFEPLSYDLATQRQGLLASTLPDALKARCLGFHEDATSSVPAASVAPVSPGDMRFRTRTIPIDREVRR